MRGFYSIIFLENLQFSYTGIFYYPEHTILYIINLNIIIIIARNFVYLILMFAISLT